MVKCCSVHTGEKTLFKLYDTKGTNFGYMKQLLQLDLNYVLISQMLQVACSIFPNVNQSACSTHDSVLNSESDFDWVLYKNNWEFP